MKYYILRPSGHDSRYCYPHVDENSKWSSEELYDYEYEQIHELPIPLIVENDYQPDDCLASENLVVSKNTKDIMKALNTNITVFESQMYLNGNKIWDPYYTIVLPKYNFFNWNSSVYKTKKNFVTNEEVIFWVDKLILDKDKIKEITNDNFFAMEEYSTRCFCTEIGKKAIEEAGLIGIAFEEVPVE